MTIEKNARVSVLRTGMEPDDGSRQGVYLAGSLRLGGGRWLACWRRAFLALCPDELSSTAERELDAAACGPEAARVAQRGSGQAGQLLDIRASGAGEATRRLIGLQSSRPGTENVQDRWKSSRLARQARHGLSYGRANKSRTGQF